MNARGSRLNTGGRGLAGGMALVYALLMTALLVWVSIVMMGAAPPNTNAQANTNTNAQAQAQRTRRPTPTPPPVLTRSESDFREWTIRFAADISPINPNRGFTSDGRRVATETPVIALSDSAFVFPIIGDTAWTTARTPLFRGGIFPRGGNNQLQYRVIPNFQGPSSIGVWQMRNIQTRQITFAADIPMRSYRLDIDEARAISQYPWPQNPYEPAIAVNLQPQLYVQSDHPAIIALVNRWLGGRSPRDAPPYRLAKFLAGQVVEHVQPNGAGLAFGFTDPGNTGVGVGTAGGFECFGAVFAAVYGRGSPHDLANLLCAVYRAAGLPARITIVADAERINEPSAQLSAVRAFVEFYLWNEAAGVGEWIPVDIQRQREFSSRPPPLDRQWEHFGIVRNGAMLAPIAHHWHPPAGVLNAGPPALWGWVTAPAIPLATQHLRITAMNTPRAGVDGPNDGFVAIQDRERR
ncbi:MAG: transglutaminase domain-containing protein [Phycisphaerales bacterium]